MTDAKNLLGIPETTLPDDPAADDLRAGADPEQVAAEHPASALAWAQLAEAALADGTPVLAYAYARTGYHRGLDALRRSGWKGAGPVPWDHVPNQGFLRCLHALAVAAERIGEDDEAQRCAQFLRDSSEQAHQVLVEGAADGPSAGQGSVAP